MKGTGSALESGQFCPNSRADPESSHEFLICNFIQKKEVIAFQKIAETRELKIIPVMIGYCNYGIKENLADMHFFNDPNHPLSAMKSHEKAKCFSELCIKA